MRSISEMQYLYTLYLIYLNCIPYISTYPSYSLTSLRPPAICQWRARPSFLLRQPTLFFRHPPSLPLALRFLRRAQQTTVGPLAPSFTSFMCPQLLLFWSHRLVYACVTGSRNRRSCNRSPVRSKIFSKLVVLLLFVSRPTFSASNVKFAIQSQTPTLITRCLSIATCSPTICQPRNLWSKGSSKPRALAIRL